MSHKHSDQVVALVQDKLKLGRGAEIGVWAGRTTEILLSKLPGLKMLYAIDPYLAYQDYLEQAHDNLTDAPQIYLNKMYQKVWTRFTHKYGERFVMLRHKSQVAARMVGDEMLDFVFIDGNHAEDYVGGDINNYWSKIRPGGILCGHDWGRVHDAVREVCGAASWCWEIQGPKHDVWWVEVK